MKNIINKIKNLTLLEFNKSLLFIALISLIYRNGSFTHSFPNPFEIIFVLLCSFTFVYLIKNNKIKEFFLSVPKNILIAICCLALSILVGWIFAITLKEIPLTRNNVLEFGGFTIGLGIFFLILFYTQNDDRYFKKYLYALLLPTFYIIFILFSKLAYYFHLQNDDTFLGLTSNPNIISKILLIPAMFFIVYALFESKSKWRKIGYFFISSAIIALLFWISARAALVSIILASILIWLIFSLNNFNWKKLFYSGLIVFAIFLTGFTITPYNNQYNVIGTLFVKKNDQIVLNNFNNESRLKFWPLYLYETIRNPVGFGPNTHMNIPYKNGKHVIGPHNTYIEIWLWGGLLGLLSFLYILYLIFRNLKVKLKSNFNSTTVALIGILCALSFSIFFNDSLQFYWFWIILALSLRR